MAQARSNRRAAAEQYSQAATRMEGFSVEGQVCGACPPQPAVHTLALMLCDDPAPQSGSAVMNMEGKLLSVRTAIAPHPPVCLPACSACSACSAWLLLPRALRPLPAASPACRPRSAARVNNHPAGWLSRPVSYRAKLK